LLCCCVVECGGGRGAKFGESREKKVCVADSVA